MACLHPSLYSTSCSGGQVEAEIVHLIYISVYRLPRYKSLIATNYSGNIPLYTLRIAIICISVRIFMAFQDLDCAVARERKAGDSRSLLALIKLFFFDLIRCLEYQYFISNVHNINIIALSN